MTCKTNKQDGGVRQTTSAVFAGDRDAAYERLLMKQLKEIGDDLMRDIDPIKITSAMTVPTLQALETIYNLREDLAFASRDRNEPTYANLQCHRLGQIANVLTMKYEKAKTLNEKIEILERIEGIVLSLTGCHSRLALTEAARLADIPGLTPFGRLRLSWVSGVDTSHCGSIVSALLPEARKAFDIATLIPAKDHCADGVREAVVCGFTEIFARALAEGDAAELGALLAAAAVWNADPALRPMMAELSRKAAALDGEGTTGGGRLSLPEKRVNAIAAEIYTRLDALSVRCGDYDYIPA